MRTFSAFIAAFVFAATSPAVAEMHHLDDTVAGHPGVTYADLLKQVVLDLKYDVGAWKGTKIRNYRHLLGESSDNGPPDEIVITDVDVLHLREGGKDRLLLLTQDSNAPSDWFGMLAAYDQAPRPKLLDAANIGSDQFNGFRDKPLLTLAGGTDIALVSSTHSNSNQAYEITTGAFLRNGRLTSAFSLFTISDHGCSYAREQALTLAPHGPDVAAKVVITTTHSGEDCNPDDKPPKAGTRTVQDLYRWDAKKNNFVPVSGAVEHLGTDNMKDL